MLINLSNKTVQAFSCLVFIFIYGCGGGSSTSVPETTVDRLPDPFLFQSQTTTQLSSLIESNAITVSGINQATNISITGGEYRINNNNYTGLAGSVNLGDTVTLRVESSNVVGQTQTANLTIGGISDAFELTTESIISRVSNTSCIAPAQTTTGSTNIQIENAFPRITINALVGLYQSPNDSTRWYGMSQSGRVYWFDNLTNTQQLNNFVDLTTLVRDSGEQGLLGMAFDPLYASNGRVFFSYINNNGQSVISRITNQGSLPLNINNMITLLTLDQPATNHNGGQISFGPDGYLYVGFGDGGGSGDTYNNGQNTQSLHAAILRLDVSGDNYTIPADNPFVGEANVLDEIYAYGLRNPWRWSFDSQTNELWVADVGQGQWEEVDLVEAGDNLGWPIMEGNHCYNSASCNSAGLTLPVAEYDHSSGDCSITGGFVYRGQNISTLQGHYIYGDYCSGIIRTTVKQADQSYLSQQLLSSGQNISSFAQGSDGEVLVLTHSGNIYRLVETETGESSIPQKLSETGCFTSTDLKTYPNYVIPYEVNSKLWSDGENKTRLFAIPDNTNINTLSDGDFLFPDQSILIKNFIRNGVYLETRLLMKHITGWVGYSYRWSDDQADAELVEGLSPLEITVSSFTHTIPARGQCFECHTSAANNSLGLEASQLNATMMYPNINQGNQLDALAGSGYLNAKPSGEQISKLADVDDIEESVETRARSYLHSNCSGCHRPGGPGSQLDFRIQTILSQTMACEQTPTSGDFGINDPKIIAIGDASRSVLIARMLSLDTNIRMPPLATEVVDVDAVDIISLWINQLENCQ